MPSELLISHIEEYENINSIKTVCRLGILRMAFILYKEKFLFLFLECSVWKSIIVWKSVVYEYRVLYFLSISDELSEKQRIFDKNPIIFI